MPDQVPDTIKAQRSNRLLALEKQMSEAYRRTFIDGHTFQTGHTQEYIRAAGENAVRGSIMRGTVTGVLHDDVMLVEGLRDFG